MQLLKLKDQALNTNKYLDKMLTSKNKFYSHRTTDKHQTLLHRRNKFFKWTWRITNKKNNNNSTSSLLKNKCKNRVKHLCTKCHWWFKFLRNSLLRKTVLN